MSALPLLNSMRFLPIGPLLFLRFDCSPAAPLLLFFHSSPKSGLHFDASLLISLLTLQKSSVFQHPVPVDASALLNFVFNSATTM
jgi:hypothetical protein